jgi:ATP-dependent exoDNAse (exonuclease V) alpha subunit
LWNAVEAGERRKDAQLAREVQLALPRELDADRQIALLHSFVREEFVSRGMVADSSLHDHTGSDGQPQPHAHVMLTMRSIDETGFGLKVRDWNSDELLVHWREQWAHQANAQLAEAGEDVRIDHRTLAAQRAEAEAHASPSPKASGAMRWRCGSRRWIANRRRISGSPGTWSKRPARQPKQQG